MKPRLLDLFSGAGGCAMGYSLAGFDVVGVDIKNQPRYPFEFHQGDALEYCESHWREFDAIHASPPCQAHSTLKNMWNGRKHLDLIPQTRAALKATGLPYVIENVPGAPLNACFMLCGTMFGLRTDCGAELRRHRYFETNWFAGFCPECQHGRQTIGVFGDHPRDSAIEKRRYISGRNRNVSEPIERTRVVTVTGHTPQTNVVKNQLREVFPVDQGRKAMGISWMVMAELSQAIPPPYTKWIGERLLAYMEHSK